MLSAYPFVKDHDYASLLFSACPAFALRNSGWLHSLPRVSSRRYVSCIPSFHRVVSLCVVLSSAGYPVDDDRITYQGYPVKPFFKSFSQSAYQGASPIFDDCDKEGKCPTRDIMKELPPNSRKWFSHAKQMFSKVTSGTNVNSLLNVLHLVNNWWNFRVDNS